MRKKLRPFTFYEQLAADGLLEEYLQQFLNDKMEADDEFRDEMYEILLKYSESVVPELEKFYLEKLIENLSFFLEYTKPWRVQGH